MRFFFLTFMLALTASVTARRPTCSEDDGSCEQDSDCCDPNSICGANMCVVPNQDPTPTL
ncbi:hypothetical protein BDR04DRAFT_1100796 [Suillus decipiens]|nr:hypothetical protein BDR04DRAFT_1100796 [Suillus decipiens]